MLSRTALSRPASSWVSTRMDGPGAPDDLRLGYWYHQRRLEPHPAVADPRFQDELLEDLADFTGARLA